MKRLFLVTLVLVFLSTLINQAYAKPAGKKNNSSLSDTKKEKTKKKNNKKADAKELASDPESESETESKSEPETNEAKLSEQYFPDYLKDPFADFQAGKYKQVLASLKPLKESKKIKAARDKIYLLEAMTYKELSQFDNAKKSLLTSRKLRAANSDMLYLLSVCEHQLGNSEKAVEYMEEALWFSKHNLYNAEEIKIKLALLYRHLGQPEKAETVLKTVPAGAHPGGLLMLAEMQLQEDKKQEAINTLKKLVNTEPENPEAKIALANALLTNTDRTFGRKDITEAKELIETVYNAENASEYIKHKAFPVYIKSKIETGELKQAKQEVDAALLKESGNPEYLRLAKQIQIELEANLPRNESGEPQFETGGPTIVTE
ncbi:MAG: tetratricopeptide repeat protein [Bdellovibrionota bacterium]